MTTPPDDGLADDPFDDLADWLAIDSTTGAERDYLEYLDALFERLGFRTRRQAVDTDRWNLLAVPDGLSGDNPRLLFSTHIDTVPPHLDVRRDGDTLYGRGACDTKGGQWAMLRAAQRLRADGIHDVGCLFVVGEEVDHCGARAATDLELSPDRILLCEPTRNRLVTGQKGMVKLDLDASGQAGHSAFPDSGSSAIHTLLDSLNAIRAHDWPVDDILGDTTLNVGTIDGGTAANVHAPRARASVLFRTVSDADSVISTVQQLADDAIEIDPVSYNDPVRFDLPPPHNRPDIDTCVVPFNTDASYLSALGDVWLVGPGDIRVAHSDDEHITRPAIRRGTDIYEQLARLTLT